MRPDVQQYPLLIAADQLHVDPSLDSQRQFQPGWAAKLEKIWNPSLLTPAIVSLRADGRYYLIDGQHSTHVALLLEGPGFLRLCWVYEGLTRKEESDLFLAANRDRRRVRPYDTYRVEITAGEPVALQVQREVRACGLDVAGSPSANLVAAVEKLKILARKRDGLVTRTLTVTERAWGRQAATWDSMMMLAVGVVLHQNWTADDNRLGRVLAKAPVHVWKSTAIPATAGGGGSSSRSTPLARAIAGAYNVRLSPARMLTVG
ncbi:DUF6551 family protein [Actinoplanes sp. NPDC024001]|uniref:DUF6551 family protein n=1 Tax=Actinoplanes sp. NPDC024001 TaxID=3154598 RepID=UPI0033F00E47